MSSSIRIASAELEIDMVTVKPETNLTRKRHKLDSKFLSVFDVVELR